MSLWWLWLGVEQSGGGSSETPLATGEVTIRVLDDRTNRSVILFSHFGDPGFIMPGSAGNVTTGSSTPTGTGSGGSGISFSPTGISGLSLWLDANDSDSLTLVGSAVSQWDDKSGEDNHVSQSTSANRPTYSGTLAGIAKNKPAIYFDGTNDYLTKATTTNLVGASGLTVFAVANVRTNQDHNVMVGIDNNNSPRTWLLYSNTLNTRFDVTRDVDPSTLIQPALDEPSSSTFSVWMGRWKDGVAELTWKGLSNTVVSTPGIVTDSNTRLAVGTHLNGSTPIDNYFVGSIAEIIVYNTGLDNSDVTEVKNYLAAKWA